MQKCDCVMFANLETKTFLTGADKNACDYDVVSEIATDGVLDTDRNRVRMSEKTMTFLVAGRLVYRKGHDYLFDALEQLPDSLDYEVRIVGTGPDQNRLVKRCRESGKLSQHVTFVGLIPYTQMEEEYRKADVLIMPSIRETTGTVILEAMSRAIPVITLDKFGAAILLDQESGWLIEAGGKQACIKAMCNAIESCILAPEEALRKGANGIRKAEMHTWEKKNEYYQQKYIELLK